LHRHQPQQAKLVELAAAGNVNNGAAGTHNGAISQLQFDPTACISNISLFKN